MTDLTSKQCKPCEGGVDPLDLTAAKQLLQNIPEWTLNEDATELSRHFEFRNFFRTMNFVNALAFVANQENHHPDVAFGYNYCTVRFSTHAIQGLSENDFICAAKLDALCAL